MRIQFSHSFEEIISLGNLLEAWKEFIRGKRNKKDVQEFQWKPMDNILSLHEDLKNKTYSHGPYHAFNISDPKPRSIHKATVRDRLLHHGLYRQLYLFFGRTFIADSYSCRKWKGTHRAINRFKNFAYKVGKNHTKTVWVLKCDVRKFFASIDQSILSEIVSKYVSDQNILWLIEKVVVSFNSGKEGVGLPLGNLTSQLLVNIYMNEFDQFVKHRLKVKNYIRYTDDFVILDCDRSNLECVLPKVREFLQSKLKLELHPDKVFIKTLASGVDFLGWVHFPDHKVLRTATKRRMTTALQNNPKPGTIASYLGLLKHGNTMKILADFLN